MSETYISPYQGLEDRAFWRTGVAESGAYPPSDIFRPKFKISKEDKIFTAGSCFAQHVGRNLKIHGFTVIDAEPAPAGIPETLARRYGYDMYSARYGNIYTVRQFLQLLQECQGAFEPQNAVWTRDGRYYDALRPNVEPGGMESEAHVKFARADHLRRISDALKVADIIVFTMGLTECWEDVQSGTIYPTAPGTIAGSHDPETCRFKNMRASEIRADFEAVQTLMQRINPDIRFLITVSPVPLTATASPNHVLPATIYSKSVLRSVAGELYEDFENVDYFPSFEIVSSHAAPQAFFKDNLREVSPDGVNRVMARFLEAHGAEAKSEAQLKREAQKAARQARRAKRAEESQQAQDDVICEEILLEEMRT